MTSARLVCRHTPDVRYCEGVVGSILQTEYYIWLLFNWGVFLLALWAVADCASRKAAAFTATGKLTKPTWLLMTGLSALISLPWLGFPMILVIIAATIAAVYLADVRPVVREISGPQRW
jgi:uncharacterized membrane protein